MSLDTANIYNNTLRAAQASARWIQNGTKTASASVGELAGKVRDAVLPCLEAFRQAMANFFSATARGVSTFLSSSRNVIDATFTAVKTNFNALSPNAQLGVAGAVGALVVTAALAIHHKYKTA